MHPGVEGVPQSKKGGSRGKHEVEGGSIWKDVAGGGYGVGIIHLLVHLYKKLEEM